MRRALDRVLGPAVEAGLRRLEHTVDPASHVRLAGDLLGAFASRVASAGHGAADRGAERLLSRLMDVWASPLRVNPPIQAAGAGAAGEEPPEELAALLRRASAGTRPDTWSLHLASLLPPAEGSAPGEPGLAAELACMGASLDSPSPEGGEPPAASLALVLLATLRTGRLAAPAAREAAGKIAEGLEPRRWFPRAGVRYGSANLLRTLLAASGAERDAYVAEVCERLLRHVEVLREESLRLPGDRSRVQRALEQLRFTHALLDVCERFGDLRFLNAALKRNDQHYRELSRSQGGGVDDVVALHYAAGVARQETLMGSVAGRGVPMGSPAP